MVYGFGPYRLDTDTLELRCGTDAVAVEPQVFRLLQYLIENRERVVSKDDLIENIWDGRIVSDATLSTRINAARRAVGDTGKGQAVIRTVQRRGFRFVADVAREGLPADAPAGTRRPVAKVSQAVRFCTTAHNVRLAYATAGSGPALVKAANWLNHLEYDWQSPVWRHVLEALAGQHLLVRYDARGNGLSDWEVDEISFEAFVRDLETVVDAVGLQRFPLLGISQGCAISIAYAVRHPERVTRLVFHGGYARGWEMRGSQKAIEERRALRTLIGAQWGQDNPALRQLFTTLFIPGATPEQMQWFNDLQRITTTPKNAVRLRETLDLIDVEHLLPKIKAPTLVLHSRGDAVVPFEEGRRLAAMIPDARFVALESQNHLILEHEPAWPVFLEEISSFLGA